MRKVLWLGMIWNWTYIFIAFWVVVQILIILSSMMYAAKPQLTSPCEELLGGAKLIIFGATLASIATVNGLFWYALPLIFLHKKPSQRRFWFYTLWVILGTTVGIFLFFLPGDLAVWSLLSGEYHYTAGEKFISLIKGELEGLGLGLLYAGSGLGYVWAYWRHLKQVEEARRAT